jgi:spore coat polysaccharide biosynthesis predicted glycosyltransferase SpsG
LLADLVFYQGVTNRPYELDWTGFGGRWFVGPEYIILRDEFHRLPVYVRHDRPRIVITGGGSDPKGVAAKAVDALRGRDLDLRVIVGPANGYTSSGVEIIKDPPKMSDALIWADVAVISYGMTAFECLALGIPTVALSISPDHKASAELVWRQSGGALVSLGEVDEVAPEQIQLTVYTQLAHQAILSKRARRFVDGRGAERVTELILE